MNPQSRHATAKFKMYIAPLQIFHGGSTKSDTLHEHISMKIPYPIHWRQVLNYRSVFCSYGIYVFQVCLTFQKHCDWDS